MKVVKIFYLDCEGAPAPSLFGEFVVPDRLAEQQDRRTYDPESKDFRLIDNPIYETWVTEVSEWLLKHYGIKNFAANLPWLRFGAPESIAEATKRYTETVGRSLDLLAMTTLKE